MDFVVAVLKYIGLGFLALIGMLVVLAILFGKRKITKWEYEAEFRDTRGREFGEFEIEMSRYEKEQPEFSLKAEFKMRHESLIQHQTVQVFLDEVLVLEGLVEKPGYVSLGNGNIQNEIDDADIGQICRVVVSGRELFAEPLAPED